MITVHHLGNSHSHVIVWLMEELGLDYDLVRHERDPRTRRSPDTLRAVHPAAKAPTIEDHGVAMIESAGIMLYILDAYGEGRLRPPANTPEAMQYFQWLTFIEGSAKGPMMQYFRLRAMTPDDPMRAAIEQAATQPLALIEAALADRETIVPGRFTAADIQLAFLEELIEGLGQLSAWPNMQAHRTRMRRRDAYRRAEAKGGKLDMRALFGTVAAS
jgi:glutathione S-transferase